MKHKLTIIGAIIFILAILLIENTNKDNDYLRNYAEQIFYEENIKIENNIVIVFDGDQERQYVLEQIEFGYFIDNKNETMVVFRELNSPHVNGIKPIKIGIFNNETGILKCETIEFNSDDFELKTFRDETTDKKFIMYIGEVIYQGYAEYNGGLYVINDLKWKKIYPTHADYWENRKVVIGTNSIIEFERIFDKDSTSDFSDYSFEYRDTFHWNSKKQDFEKMNN